MTIHGFRRNEPLASHCTWRIGGPADFFTEVQDVEQLGGAISFARASSLPHLVIGRGSNLLFDDDGYRGVVIKLGSGFARCEARGEQIIAGAGTAAWNLARFSCCSGRSGLEHIVGIPGTVGGLVVMNAGSGRRSVGESVVWVDVLMEGRHVERLTVEACLFCHRSSRFQDQDHVVLGACFRLERRTSSEVRAEMLEILRARRRKFPLKEPSCGSVFKASPELLKAQGPPGLVIERLGLKGLRWGGLEISPRHANFFVNRGGGTAQQALGLIRYVCGIVKERFGVDLQSEVLFVHSSGRVAPASQFAFGGGAFPHPRT